MTSTITGLPDRYRPLDEVGPEEQTPTGVIRCWRAKDRVLNRDVAHPRAHPGRPGRARLDHPRADRRRPGHPGAGDGLRRLRGQRPADDAGRPAAPPTSSTSGSRARPSPSGCSRGPLPEREVRTVLRRLADGVAEAHRVGLAVGGLTPEQRRAAPERAGRPARRARGQRHHGGRHRRPRRAAGGLPDRPAPATASRPLSGAARPGRAGPPGPLHRAGPGLSCVAAMAALLAERPPHRRRAGTAAPPGRPRPTSRQRLDCAGCADAADGRRRAPHGRARRGCDADSRLPPVPRTARAQRGCPRSAPRRRHRRGSVAAGPRAPTAGSRRRGRRLVCARRPSRRPTTTTPDGSTTAPDHRRPHAPGAGCSSSACRCWPSLVVVGAGLVVRHQRALGRRLRRRLEGSTPSASAAAAPPAPRRSRRRRRRRPVAPDRRTPRSSTRAATASPRTTTTCRCPSTATRRRPGPR